MKKRIVSILLFAALAYPVLAQTSNTSPVNKKPSKAWEFGLGGSVFQFSRASFSNFSQVETGYIFDLKLDQTLFGGNLYVARELNDHFYLDLQETLGVTANNQGNKTNWLYMLGPGLQWRLGEYFGSKHIDPYLRAGINYMHKDFEIAYTGAAGMDDQQMKWILNNLNNKDGADRKNLMPISLGAGLNMWLNDKWGIGIQGDYLLMPYKDVANSLQGTLRVIYRLGGKSKKAQPTVQYVDRIVEVEKRVEAPVKTGASVPAETVKTVEKTDTIFKEVEKLLFLDNIYFDFDKAHLTSESNKTLDELAGILKQDTDKRYLITGYTDSKGSDEYNMQLSRKRAEAVVKALIERGVPPAMLKARGVGSKIAYAKSSESDEIRYGDRKMTIDLISNKAYWDYLPDYSF